MGGNFVTPVVGTGGDWATIYLTAEVVGSDGTKTPAPHVTWRLPHSPSEAHLVASGASATFSVDRAGVYTVAATSAGRTAGATVTVHGPAAAVVLTGPKGGLPTDGIGTQVPVTVVDAGGRLLGDFSGIVTVTDSANQLCANDAGQDVVHIANGVGQVPVCAGKSGGSSSDTLTASDVEEGVPRLVATTPVTGVRYRGLTITNVTPKVVALAYQVEQADPPYLSAASQQDLSLLVLGKDQAGNTVLSVPPVVTVRLSGPGSLSEAGLVTSERLTTPQTGDLLTVFSRPGHAGTITVTASAPGLQGFSYTVPSVLSGKPVAVSVVPAGTGITVDSQMPYQVYKVTLVDSKGNPVVGTSDQLSVTDNAGQQRSANPVAAYFGQAGHAALLYGEAGRQWFRGVFFGPPQRPPFAVYTQDGQGEFAVQSAAVGSAPVTVTVRDAARHLSTRVTYDWQPGTPAAVWVRPSPFFASAISPQNFQPSCTIQLPQAQTGCLYAVLAGTRVPYSLQLVDGDGNPVALAEEPITVSLGSQSAATLGHQTGLPLWTGATGAALATVVAPLPQALPANEVGLPDYLLQAEIATAAPAILTSPGQCSCGPRVTVVDSADYAARVTVAGAPAHAVTAGSVLALHVKVETASGRPLAEFAGASDFADDALAVSSSNPSVVGLLDANTDRDVGQTFVPPTLNGTSPLTWTLPQVKAVQPGTTIITVRDVSNPARPADAFTVEVRK